MFIVSVQQTLVCNCLQLLELVMLGDWQPMRKSYVGYLLGQEGVRGGLEAGVRTALCHVSQACSYSETAGVYGIWVLRMGKGFAGPFICLCSTMTFLLHMGRRLLTPG